MWRVACPRTRAPSPSTLRQALSSVSAPNAYSATDKKVRIKPSVDGTPTLITACQRKGPKATVLKPKFLASYNDVVPPFGFNGLGEVC